LYIQNSTKTFPILQAFPKARRKRNDVRLEGEVGVEKARQEENFKDRGTCEKRSIFLNPKIGRFRKNNLFSPKNFMIFFPPKERKKLPKNI